MCATSDIWSRANVSFIAVSIHYVHPNTLELQTKIIACEHFTGNHTSNNIAEKLKSIFDKFEILQKVAYITTDSAANYIASLKYNGDNYRSVRMGYFWSDTESDCVDAEPETNCNNVDDDDDAITTEMDSDPDAFIAHELLLPLPTPLLGNMNHVKCGAHQLDKLGSIHASKARNKCSIYADKYDLCQIGKIVENSRIQITH